MCYPVCRDYPKAISTIARSSICFITRKNNFSNKLLEKSEAKHLSNNLLEFLKFHGGIIA